MKRLLLLLMLVSQPAWAEWVELGKNGEGFVTFYIDQTTIRKSDSGRRAWTMHSYEQPQPNPVGTFRSTKGLIEFDCAGERSRRLQTSLHAGPMGGGQLISIATDPAAWRPAIPGSVGRTQLEAACRMPLK